MTAAKLLCPRVVDSTTKVGNFEQITTVSLHGTSDVCCWFYHKGRKFRANHNRQKRVPFLSRVVDSTTKVGNFEQITTSLIGVQFSACCWFYHKGRKFRANHNGKQDYKDQIEVVDSTTKVGNFEQITTRRIRTHTFPRCWFYHKGRKFRANHNWKV